jgi:hypothetical protein
METLHRMEFVAQLVTHGLLSPVDGIDVLNRVARGVVFTKALATYGLVVEER